MVSSVSPERWLIMHVKPARCAMLTASRVSVKEPIWLTFTSRALGSGPLNSVGQAHRVGHEQVVADELDPLADV